MALALAAIAITAGIGVARAELVTHWESADSTTSACLAWSEYTSDDSSYKSVTVQLCGRQWSYGTSSASFKEIVAERVVQECSFVGGCGDTYRERYEGSASDAELSINRDTGVFLITADLEGEDGSVCAARATATTTETGNSTTSGPMWKGEGGRDWARVGVFDGRTERGVSVGTNPSSPYAGLFQNDRYWSARSGSGSGSACGWAEAQGSAGATMFTYSYSNSSDTVAPQSPVSTSTSTTLPEPPDPNDPLPTPGSEVWGSAGIGRGGYAEGVTEGGEYAGAFWFQGADQWLYPNSDPEGPYADSSLWAYVGDIYFQIPLTPASVLYDPAADEYTIDAAVEGCEVHLTATDPWDRYNSTSATAVGGGRYLSGGDNSQGDPWVFTGTAGSFTGATTYTSSHERRTYTGTVCGTAVSLPGDVAVGVYSHASNS